MFIDAGTNCVQMPTKWTPMEQHNMKKHKSTCTEQALRKYKWISMNLLAWTAIIEGLVEHYTIQFCLPTYIGIMHHLKHS